MPEPTSQATPQEPVIPASVEVPEFTPETGSTPQTEPPTEQKPLTLDDYRRIAREEATRIAQSQVAKGESRIQKQIQERFAALEQTKSALSLSDQQVAEAKQKIVAEAYSPPAEEPPTNPPQSQAQADIDPVQYMNAQIGKTFAKAGQSVTRSDPEFQALQDTINKAWTDPDGLTTIILAAHEAATAKAARLQRTTQTAAGRIIGGGQPSSGQAPATGNPIDLWTEGYRK
jgi:hypothetical protein